MSKCLCCEREFETDKSLHAHLKKHEISIEEYYHKYYPRYDLFTKELIPFKNKEYYFGHQFINRTNLLYYLKSLDKEQLNTFLIKLFTDRKEEKGLVKAPSQIELRSSILPSVNLLQRLGIDYNKLLSSVGLEKRYEYDAFDLTFKEEPMIIFCDTREQNPLNFKGHEVVLQGLNFGDYCCKSHFTNIFIERKSALDFISTFSTGYERVCREFDRALELNSFIYVLCETEINEMLGFHHKPFFNKKTRVNADFLFHNIRDICQKYPNVQFGFCKGRVHMVEVVEKLFLSEMDITKYDLQWLIDSKIV